MKERPILFSTPMVQAILDGRKSQTRRVTRDQGDAFEGYEFVEDMHMWPDEKNSEHREYTGWVANFSNLTISVPRKCPYGQIGDVLWVRETFVFRDKHDRYYFRADYPEFEPYAHNGWKPSIHMPKTAARIWLEITDIWVEKLCDISDEEAIAEGVMTMGFYPGYEISPTGHFEGLWNLIHGDNAWDANPWVWVVSFKVLSTTGKPEKL